MIVECRGAKLWPICAGASQYGLLYPKRGVLGGGEGGGGGGESQPTNKQNESLCTEKGDKSVQCRLPLVRGQPNPPPPPHTNRDLIILKRKYLTLQLYNYIIIMILQ